MVKLTLTILALVALAGCKTTKPIQTAREWSTEELPKSAQSIVYAPRIDDKGNLYWYNPSTKKWRKVLAETINK